LSEVQLHANNIFIPLSLAGTDPAEIEQAVLTLPQTGWQIAPIERDTTPGKRIYFEGGLLGSSFDSEIGGLGARATLTCTNLLPGTFYTLQWSTALTGPWFDSWMPLADVTADARGVLSLELPTYYRLIAAANTHHPHIVATWERWKGGYEDKPCTADQLVLYCFGGRTGGSPPDVTSEEGKQMVANHICVPLDIASSHEVEAMAAMTYLRAMGWRW